jgi:hypothetical protein
VDDFERMLAEQNGLCAICCEAPAVHVDHDHETGRVRGLLCFNCNGALGQFRDRADLMLGAVLSLRQDDPTRFVALPSDVVGFCLGGDLDPRPAGEPWPVEYDDESGAA